VSCHHAFEDDRAARYVGGDLSDEERDAFEIHALDCPDCLRALHALSEAPALLRDEGSTRPAPNASTGRAPHGTVGLRPASWSRPALAWAAALALGTVTGYLLRGNGRSGLGTAPPVSSPDPVFRSGGEASIGHAVEAVVEVAAAPDVSLLPRGVILLAVPAAAPAVGERIEVALRDAAGVPSYEASRAASVDGRVRIVLDTTGLRAGTWRLELRRLGPGGAVLDTAAFALELR